MTYYAGIHIYARPSNFTLRKYVELTRATRKRIERSIPGVVHILFKYISYVISHSKKFHHKNYHPK
jgi:hypothetical protein